MIEVLNMARAHHFAKKLDKLWSLEAYQPAAYHFYLAVYGKLSLLIQITCTGAAPLAVHADSNERALLCLFSHSLQ